MINEEVVKSFSEIFQKLVNDIDTSLNEYHESIRNLVTDKNASSELNDRINQDHPDLYRSIQGVPSIVKWMNISKTVIDYNSTFSDTSSNALMLAYESDSKAKSSSEDTITKIDGQFEELESNAHFMHVFDEPYTEDIGSLHSNEIDLNVVLSSAGTKSTVGLAAGSRNHDEWEKCYYLLQNGLLRYKGMDGLFHASKDLSKDASDRKQLQELIAWSEEQKQHFTALHSNQKELMSSLSKRYGLKWDNLGALPGSQRSSSLQATAAEAGVSTLRGSPSSESRAAPTCKGSSSVDSCTSASMIVDTGARSPSNALATVPAPFAHTRTDSSQSSTTTPRAQKPRASAVRKPAAKKATARPAAQRISAAEKAEIKRQEKEWNEYYDLLLEYGEGHDDYNAPIEYVVGDKLLGEWLSIQLASMGEYETEAPRWFDKLAGLMETGKLWPQEQHSSSNSKEESEAKASEASGVGDSTGHHPSPTPTSSSTLSGSKRRADSSEDTAARSSKRPPVQHTSLQRPNTMAMSLKNKDLFPPPPSSSGSSRGSDAASNSSLPCLKPPALGARHSSTARGSGGYSSVASSSGIDSTSGVAVRDTSMCSDQGGVTAAVTAAGRSDSSLGAAFSVGGDRDSAVAATVVVADSAHAGDPAASSARSDSVSVTGGLQACTLKPVKTEPSDGNTTSAEPVPISPHRYVAVFYNDSTDDSSSGNPDTVLFGIGQVINTEQQHGDEGSIVEVKLLLRRGGAQPPCQRYREDCTSLAAVARVMVSDLVLDRLQMLCEERAGQGSLLTLTAESYDRLRQWYEALPVGLQQMVR